MPPVMAAKPHRGVARPGGLRGLWAWLRRSVLRVEPRQSAPPPHGSPRRSAAAPVEPVEAEAPVEPRGAKLREGGVRPASAGALLSSIHEGLSAAPPLPHVVRELLRELSDPVSNARSVARIAASDPALAASL